jgi:hypothetical protein
MRERLGDVGDYGQGLVSQLPPSDPHDAISRSDHLLITPAVLERGAMAVSVVSVDFDNQALPRPQEVGDVSSNGSLTSGLARPACRTSFIIMRSAPKRV